jgi:uncharacterized protein YigE (DUF2233 family)
MIPSRVWKGYLLALAGWFGVSALSARADDPPPPGLQAVTFHGQSFLTRTINPKNEDLRLFLNDDHGQLLHDFASLDKFVSAQGGHLIFAANAGMFEPNSQPVGLLVLGSVQQNPINFDDGQGNFYMKPNGVFLINDKHEAHIVESTSYASLLTPAVWATQSGPLLVHGGEIHPEFNADSKSRKIRSGVGVTKDGIIEFALSRTPVTFYEFASLFRDRMLCPNALYLDGEISAFYVPGEKDPVPHSFGPMFGLVEKANP